jgi:hypothetical protein
VGTGVAIRWINLADLFPAALYKILFSVVLRIIKWSDGRKRGRPTGCQMKFFETPAYLRAGIFVQGFGAGNDIKKEKK